MFSLKFVDSVVIITPKIGVKLIAIDDPVVLLMNNTSRQNFPNVVHSSIIVLKFESTILSIGVGHVIIGWFFVFG